MRTYLMINPFPATASHGIHNYYLQLRSLLDSWNIETDYIYNENSLSTNDFREFVKEYVETHYGVGDVLIEAPEVKAATLLLGNEYDVHIRLHTPGYVAQKYDGAKINEVLMKEELLVLHESKYVSSPSYGLLEEIKNNINRKDISVFKNPIDISKFRQYQNIDKEYDLIFMGRFQKLKGVEYINDILSKLPASYKVILLGHNATKFRLTNVKCQVKCIDNIAGEERFEYVAKSKVLMQLSNFENCSMVVLEAFACGTVVCAWNVGGNSELGFPEILKIFRKGDCQSMAEGIVKVVNASLYPKYDTFKDCLLSIIDDFRKGFVSILDGKEYQGLDYKNYEKNVSRQVYKPLSSDNLFKLFGERILGFSVSNEHIEEMWMPVIDKFGSDYRFICRRPLGFMYKFNNPYPVDKNKFYRYDWIQYPNVLMDHIRAFKPHKIFFHNGLHPMYQEVLNRVKKVFPDIPIVYSELGWFPQDGNIYFDEYGTNGRSKIATEDFETFCEADYPDETEGGLRGNYDDSKHILIITQLENDTNLIINSPRFKKMESFISYVLSEIGDKGKIIIKTHPLDRQRDRFEKFNSSNVTVVHDADLNELLENSKAVVGINSTVLMQALHYDTNVYAFGDGLLNGKRVVIECQSAHISLKEIWRDDLYANRVAKKMVIDEFKRRQINIESLKGMTILDCLNNKAFRPLLTKIKTYSLREDYEYVKNKYNESDSLVENPVVSKISKVDNQELLDIRKSLLQISKDLLMFKKQNTVTRQTVVAVGDDVQKKKLVNKKMNKLKNRPYDFFNDSKNPLLRMLGIFVSKK